MSRQGTPGQVLDRAASHRSNLSQMSTSSSRRLQSQHSPINLHAAHSTPPHPNVLTPALFPISRPKNGSLVDEGIIASMNTPSVVTMGQRASTSSRANASSDAIGSKMNNAASTVPTSPSVPGTPSTEIQFSRRGSMTATNVQETMRMQESVRAEKSLATKSLTTGVAEPSYPGTNYSRSISERGTPLWRGGGDGSLRSPMSSRSPSVISASVGRMAKEFTTARHHTRARQDCNPDRGRAYDHSGLSSAASSPVTWSASVPASGRRETSVELELERHVHLNLPQDQGQSSVGNPSSEEALGREIIMAVNVRGKTVGCAYYDGHLAKLFIMQDMIECNALDMMGTVKVQLRPTLILTNSRLDENIMDALSFDGTDFSHHLAKSKLISVAINMRRQRAGRNANSNASSNPGFMAKATMHHYSSSMDESVQRDAQLHLSNVIDLQSNESVACAGAIISFLTRHNIARHASSGGRTIVVFSIESFTIKSFMFVNTNTLSSLQIFEDESHPSMHSSVSGSKEGFSLFSILNHAKTSQGRYLLKQWLLRPSMDLDVIHARHQTVECFMRAENQTTVNQLTHCLSHVKNIPKVLQELPRKTTIAEWQAILQFVYYCLKIYNCSQEIFVGEASIIHKILHQFVIKDLMDICANINDVLDFDESVNEGRCVVKHNVDEELDQMRQTYHGLDSFLSEIAKEISQTIPSEFTSTINVIYFPQLGYLITVPINPNWQADEDYHLEGLSYQFSTESTVYYKNGAMRELDEHLGDIHGLIVDREIDILQGLQERVLEYTNLLIICSDICAELDVLMSLAHAARMRNYKRPVMTDRNILQIVNGRHPLQELVVPSFVTNDTLMGEIQNCGNETTTAPSTLEHRDYRTIDQDADIQSHSNSQTAQEKMEKTLHDNKVMVLSGANSSGKSVFLKQVALITYMAHIGSFVPADSAVVGLTDKILTRLQTRETVSSIQSAFMIDLQQVNLAIKKATRRSLVVIDEFGKGTIPTDGAGMFCGVIEDFARRPIGERPKVLVTTHFHELLENNLLDLRLPVSLYTMEVYQEPDCLEATFMFRVIPGTTPSSLGPACAAMAGLPPQVVQRGLVLHLDLDNELDLGSEPEPEPEPEQALEYDLDFDLDLELDMKPKPKQEPLKEPEQKPELERQLVSEHEQQLVSEHEHDQQDIVLDLDLDLDQAMDKIQEEHGHDDSINNTSVESVVGDTTVSGDTGLGKRKAQDHGAEYNKGMSRQLLKDIEEVLAYAFQVDQMEQAEEEDDGENEVESQGHN
ncbi:MutS protein msh5 [Mortierella polycephala]|uniref:MutS protein msh5 n=1 Tax=Mortierella polycephala TaxID=41804 RepID=A0A9P6TVY3_9FUNG|nr:MutS protein msh5 [Mortierella polycephala]